MINKYVLIDIDVHGGLAMGYFDSYKAAYTQGLQTCKDHSFIIAEVCFIREVTK